MHAIIIIYETNKIKVTVKIIIITFTQEYTSYTAKIQFHIVSSILYVIMLL